MSFRLKTILGIALIESIVLILLILIGMHFFHQSNESHLQQRVETTSLLFSKAIKNAVIANDLATLESFIEDILTLPDIVYARISSRNFILAEGGNKAMLERSHIPDSSLKNVNDGVFDMAVEIREAEHFFGSIEIGLSTKKIEQDITNAQQWAISIATAEVVLVAIFSFILGTYLTRRLLRLKKASEVITQSGPGLQIKVRGNDEISDVARAFNSMSSTLKENYEKLSKSIDSEKKMTEKANRNQAQNKAILTASLDAMITINQDGEVVDFNAVAEQTFGWSYEEVAGKNLTDFMIPKNKQKAHSEGMKHFLLTKESPILNQRIELAALHKRGHSFPIEINIAPIETQQGISFTAFIRDISSRLEAETELHLAAQTFESSEAIFISNADGNIIRINKAFTVITGYREIDVIGQNPKILSSGRHASEYYKSMWDTLLDKGKWSGEIYNKRKDGEIYPEYLSISSVKNKSGEISHYIAHFMDISEQKNNEENLRQARQQADASNASKSRFLASMSHEIRTPMNAVLGILDLLKDTTLSEKQLSFISTARESGELLMTIINDILDFTKMDNGEKVLQTSEFDLHLLLNNCISLLQHLANKKSLQLSVEYSSLPQFIKADPDRLKQILINLINNAIKFTDHGSVKVVATVHVEKENKLLLRFKVIDTGIGIATENQALLFDEFTMVDQTHSRRHEGTGLGLAICKRLIKMMNGAIKIDSELGKGSTFEFTLEVEKVDQNKQQKAHIQQLQVPNAGTKILLAEDNLANQMVIKSILEHANMQIDVVKNGLEAVEAVQNKHYEVILMDISMPEMDGMTATKTIRALPPTINNIPIIALTAHTLSGDQERFLSAGMNDYLSKPINKELTLNCIAKWANSSQPNIKEDSETMPDLENDNYVDEHVLQQLVTDTDAQIVPELIQLYIKDTQQRIDKINQAITKQDFTCIEFEAHTIGSSAVAHGNAKLHSIAKEIETLCKQQQQQSALEQAKLISEVAKKSFKLLATRADKGFE